VEFTEREAAVREAIRRTDPELLAAADEVDRATLAYSASLTPLERLRAATDNAHALARFSRVPPTSR